MTIIIIIIILYCSLYAFKSRFRTSYYTAKARAAKKLVDLGLFQDPVAGGGLLECFILYIII